jgi:hypothetical protein
MLPTMLPAHRLVLRSVISQTLIHHSRMKMRPPSYSISQSHDGWQETPKWKPFVPVYGKMDKLNQITIYRGGIMLLSSFSLLGCSELDIILLVIPSARATSYFNISLGQLTIAVVVSVPPGPVSFFRMLSHGLHDLKGMTTVPMIFSNFSCSLSVMMHLAYP